MYLNTSQKIAEKKKHYSYNDINCVIVEEGYVKIFHDAIIHAIFCFLCIRIYIVYANKLTLCLSLSLYH